MYLIIMIFIIYDRRNYNIIITKHDSIAMKINPKICEKIKEATRIVNMENIPLESLKDLLKIYSNHIKNIYVKFNTNILKLKYNINHSIK